MSKVFLVTDSTADLSQELAREMDVTVIPLNVHFGDEVYKDGVNITSKEFFQKLKETDSIPRTSQPSAGDFEKLYRELGEKAGDEEFTIVSVHLSSDMSGTCQSAEMARQMLEPEGFDIRVVDSRLVSAALGMMVRVLRTGLDQGMDVDGLLDLARSISENTKIFFTVDTLEFLEKNGRIGRAQALLGGLLRIKPVLEIKDGVVAPFEKLRGSKKVIPRLQRLVEEHVPEGGKAHVAVMHTGEPDQYEKICAGMEEKGLAHDITEGIIGPVVGCHSGPGAMGVAVCPVMFA